MASEDASPKEEREVSAGFDALKKHPLVKLAAVLLPALITSLAAFTGAGQIAGEKSARAKDAAEAGWQFTRETLQTLRDDTRKLEARLSRLDADLGALRRAIRKNAPAIRVAAPAPAAPPQAPAPAPLPTDLDAALKVKAPGAAP